MNEKKKNESVGANQGGSGGYPTPGKSETMKEQNSRGSE